MAVTIRVKRGTATQWAARTIPLLSGEIGYDLTNKITKIGDGATLWATLPSIDSSGASNTGDVTFDGVQVIGAGTASGDGYGLGTLELVPDGNITSDQYLIIDPTAPNHIHIRAGGTQDASNADLFLGGERNNVHISDGGRNLSISTRPEQVINTYVNANEISNTQFIISNSANINIGDTLFSIESGDTATVNSVTLDSPNAGSQTVTAEIGGIPAQFISGSTYIFIHEESYNNQWIFDSDGYLYGPGEGVLLLVEGIYNAKSHLTLQAMGINNKVILDGQNGEFINDASDPENQNLIDGAPTALDTLNELAAAINDDSSFASTITTALGNKLDSSTASSTYLTQANASSTYATQTALGGKLDSSAFTYSSITIPVYTAVANLPDASENHGRWAHVHGEGAMYYAHGGSWYRALSQDDLYISTSAQSSSYTLNSSDLGKMIEMSNGGTLTITDSASFPVGFSADILQTGSSQVTIAGNGFTPNATPGLKLRSQWSSATIVKRALNSWVVFGDLSA